MPNIKSYNASPVSLQPSERGAQAYDTAGRRIGPLYNAAASDQREQGRLEAAGIKSRLWPLDIAHLNNLGAEGSGATKGSSLKVVGGTSTGYGGPTEGGAGWAGHGQISRGAAALGNLLSDGGYAVSSTGGGKEYVRGVDYPDDTASPGTKAASAAAAERAPSLSEIYGPEPIKQPSVAPAPANDSSWMWDTLNSVADWIDSGVTSDPTITSQY